MAKPLSKVSVRCPHCAADQLEPEQAKSTFCRTCSQYFAVSPSTLATAKLAHREKGDPKSFPGFAVRSGEVRSTTASTADAQASSSVPSGEPAGGIFRKLEGWFGKPGVKLAECFECSGSQEVAAAAQSSTCRACGAHIDLRDYKINASFSRNIKTRGSIYLGVKGDLSSSKIFCADAVIHGRMRGNMQCRGKVLVKFQGRLSGSLETGLLTIEKGSDVVFSRPLKASAVVIAGKMTGLILSDSHVTIHKSGSLEGGVQATGFNVEKGGCFQGELTISPRSQRGLEELSARVGENKVARFAETKEQLITGETKPVMG